MKNKLFEILLVIALAMGVYACWPESKQEGITLHSVRDQQQELVNRGHDIKIDGIFGPETDLALSIEVSKGGE